MCCPAIYKIYRHVSDLPQAWGPWRDPPAGRWAWWAPPCTPAGQGVGQDETVDSGDHLTASMEGAVRVGGRLGRHRHRLGGEQGVWRAVTGEEGRHREQRGRRWGKHQPRVRNMPLICWTNKVNLVYVISVVITSAWKFCHITKLQYLKIIIFQNPVKIKHMHRHIPQ